jgi:type I restriction enzyme, S subunit
VSRYRTYAEYKDSGVEFIDELPVGWQVLRGKYVFSEYSERSEAGEEQLLSVSEYYGVKPRGEVIDEGDFLSRAESLIGYKKCQKNDLVMNIMLAWKCGLGVSKYDGIVSPAYSVFRFNGDALPDYMHYLLRTDTYTGHFKTRSTGVIDSRLRLYPESFSDVAIILPSTIEQEKIATFLDYETAKIDALIEKQQRLIELLKEKRQAVISHAVTKGLNPNAPMKDSGVEWLGEVPAHWGIASLGYYAQISTGATPDRSNPNYWNGAIPWIKTGEVKYDEIFEAEEYISEEAVTKSSVKLSPPGTVLMAMYGQGVTRGRVAILGVTATYNQACAAINTSQEIWNKYLICFFMAAYHAIRDDGNETSQMNLNADIVGKFKVSIPPLDEQHQIVRYITPKLEKFDSMIDRAETAIGLMQERRTALISAAVTGKIDVRNWQAAA